MGVRPLKFRVYIFNMESCSVHLVKFPRDRGVTAEDESPCDLMSQPLWLCWGKGVEGTYGRSAMGKCLWVVFSLLAPL